MISMDGFDNQAKIMKYRDANSVLLRIQEVTEYLGIDLIDINQKGIFGNTPLAIAITWRDIDAALKLIEAGADLDARNENGDTALHRAVSFACRDIAEILLKSGSNISDRNDDGLTPLDLAILMRNKELIHLLSNRVGR